MSKAVTAGDYISVSYFPGNLAGTDGGKAKAFGPEGIKNPKPEPEPEPDNIFASSSGNSIKAFPNPASDNINIVCEAAPVQIELLNSMGARLFSGVAETTSYKMDVSQYKSGMYFIKATDSGNKVNILKIILK